jgi:hypothetical protein
MANGADANPFQTAPAPELPLSIGELALRLGYAAAFGVAVAGVYFLTQRKKRAEASSFVSTLVLLSILLGMVTLVIGNSVARAFGLVGALSIVRFRTVVEDTRDTAFVIFAVVAGMAAGAGAYTVGAIGIPIVGLMAWLLAGWGRVGASAAPAATAKVPPGRLVIRMGIGSDPGGALAAVLAEHLIGSRLVSVGTARQGAAVELTYEVRLKEGANPVALIAAVNKVEGVQNVEWTAAEDDD